MAPTFKVVTTRARPGPKPPRKLTGAGLQMWNTIMSEFHIDDAGGIQLLCSACEAIDLASQLREQITRDGTIVQTASGPKEHPGLRAELQNRSFAMKSLERLGITTEPKQKSVGRPAAGRGWQPPDDDGDVA